MHDGDEVHITASACLVWDDLVTRTCAMGWAGLECLSGNPPGWVGAVPVQNVGAYGQEVSDTLVDVRVMGREKSRYHHPPCRHAGTQLPR